MKNQQATPTIGKTEKSQSAIFTESLTKNLVGEQSTLVILQDFCGQIATVETLQVLSEIITKYIPIFFGDVYFDLSFFQENDLVVFNNFPEGFWKDEAPAKVTESTIFETFISLKNKELTHKLGLTSHIIWKYKKHENYEVFLSLYSSKQIDFFEDYRVLLDIVGHIITSQLLQINEQVSVAPVLARSTFQDLKGNSVALQKVFDLIDALAVSDATVLLLGESGTGKELVAKAIHENSLRKNKAFIKVNCAAIPATLLESELFGHEKGAFTGANQRRIGKFELAHEGTLFLDEIGELPIELQVKLLRVLQEQEIERLGGGNPIKIKVRVIAATNRNLEEEVLAGNFRLDLYYRLNVFPIKLPALRERKEDIPNLVAHFIEKYAPKVKKNIKGISNKVLEKLLIHPWPGNIRELEFLIERSILLAKGDVIRQVVFAEIPAQSNPILTIAPLATIEHDYILKVLKLCNGRIFGENGAAVRLNLPPTTLISKMQKLGIKKEHFVDTDK